MVSIIIVSYSPILVKSEVKQHYTKEHAKIPNTYVEAKKASTPLRKTLRKTLNLITGDKVIVEYTIEDGEINIVRAFATSNSSDERVDYITLKNNNGFYIIPRNIDLKKFSIELFNIKRLIEEKGKYRLLIKYKYREKRSFARETGVPYREEVLRDFKNLIIKTGGKIVKTFKTIPWAVVEYEKDKVSWESFEELKESPLVEKVYLDFRLKVSTFESVPLINATKLWKLGYNGSGIKIAILDTGIAWDHEAFLYPNGTSKVILSKSFVDYNDDGIPDEDPYDGHGHGTHCAGIAAAFNTSVSEGTYIVGVAPGALLINGKVLSNDGWGYMSWIIKGVEWAVSAGADVISMSLGGWAYEDTDPLAEAVNQAVLNGTVVVVAAGNSWDLWTISTPGIAEYAITVGASTKSDELASFSSKGPTPGGRVKPDIVAPGVDILSSTPWGTESWSGTSMATPHVAGAAALLLQAHKDWSPFDVKNAIISSALRNVFNYNYTPFEIGGGRIDVYKAYDTPIMPNESVVSFKHIFPENGTLTKTISIENLKKDTYVLSFSIEVINALTHELEPTDFMDTVVGNNILKGGESTAITITLNATKAPWGIIGGYIDIYGNGTIHLGKIVFGYVKVKKLVVKVYNINDEPDVGRYVDVLCKNETQWLWEITDENGEAKFYVIPSYAYNIISMKSYNHTLSTIPVKVIYVKETGSSTVTVELRDKELYRVDFSTGNESLRIRQREINIMGKEEKYSWSMIEHWIIGMYYAVNYDRVLVSNISAIEYSPGDYLGIYLQTQYQFTEALTDEDIAYQDKWWTTLHEYTNITSNINTVFNAENTYMHLTKYLLPNVDAEYSVSYNIFNEHKFFGVGFSESIIVPTVRREYFNVLSENAEEHSYTDFSISSTLFYASYWCESFSGWSNVVFKPGDVVVFEIPVPVAFYSWYDGWSLGFLYPDDYAIFRVENDNIAGKWCHAWFDNVASLEYKVLLNGTIVDEGYVDDFHGEFLIDLEELNGVLEGYYEVHDRVGLFGNTSIYFKYGVKPYEFSYYSVGFIDIEGEYFEDALSSKFNVTVGVAAETESCECAYKYSGEDWVYADAVMYDYNDEFKFYRAEIPFKWSRKLSLRVNCTTGDKVATITLHNAIKTARTVGELMKPLLSAEEEIINSTIIAPGSNDPRGPCAGASTIDVAAGMYLASALSSAAPYGGLRVFMDWQIANYDSEKVYRIYRPGNVVAVGGPGVNLVTWLYHYGKTVEGEPVLPVYIGFDEEGAFIYSKASGMKYRMENDYYQGKPVTDYAMIVGYNDVEDGRYVIIVAGLSGFSTWNAAKWLSENMQIDCSAVILRLYDENGDTIPEEITIAEIIP